MNTKTIEVELRAEILPADVERIKSKLNELGYLLSSTKRLSVMYFGEINGQKTDIRVRITDGDCEIAAKFGSFDSHDRMELCQAINKNQFIGMVRMFSQFKFNTKIGERITHNYQLPNGVVASLVFAGNIAYVELERMSSEPEVSEGKLILQKIADKLNLKILDEHRFEALCQKLSKECDWPFNGSDEDYTKLQKIFSAY